MKEPRQKLWVAVVITMLSSRE